MTKDEFQSLPLRLALGVLFDLLPGIASVEKPRAPLPPKYDDRMPKKAGQFCWMSEMTLDDLSWWYKKTSESANGGGQYAEKDGKLAAKISHWVKWRQAFPNELWSGERNRVKVTAAPPSREPRLHEWENNRSSGNRSQSKPADDGYGDAPTGGGGSAADDYGDMDEGAIPF